MRAASSTKERCQPVVVVKRVGAVVVVWWCVVFNEAPEAQTEKPNRRQNRWSRKQPTSTPQCEGHPQHKRLPMVSWFGGAVAW